MDGPTIQSIFTDTLAKHGQSVEEKLDRLVESHAALQAAMAGILGRQDTIISKQGEQNGRLSKAEQAVRDLEQAVHKQQWLEVERAGWEMKKAAELAEVTEGAAEKLAEVTKEYNDRREREERKWQWRIGVVLTLSPLVFGVIVYVLGLL